MDAVPTSNELSFAPPGTSIHSAADALLAIIETERKEAATVIHHRYLQLEQSFISYKNNANAAVAVEQARVSDAHQKLLVTQALLAQYQQLHMHTIDTRWSAVNAQPGQRQIEGGQVAQQSFDAAAYHSAQREALSARQRLEEMQRALLDVGIVFSSEDNSLRFEAGWAAVLSQLEARDFGVMNAGRLNEILGQLAHKLQHDRETIEQLGQQVLALDAEKAQLVNHYELDLEVLKLENALLREETTHRSQPPLPPPDTATISEVPESSPSMNTVLPSISRTVQVVSTGPSANVIKGELIVSLMVMDSSDFRILHAHFSRTQLVHTSPL